MCARSTTTSSAFEAAAGAPVGAIRIVAIATETPEAVFALGDYAGVVAAARRRSPGAPRIWRPASAPTTARLDGGYDGPYQLARSLCLLAAGAAGVAAIDTIYTDFRDPAGLAAECAAARRSGFVAKMAIHPAQLAAINEAFSVSAEERDWAERVIAAFAAQPDAGTLALDGKMIDKPHLVLARRLLGLPAALADQLDLDPDRIGHPHPCTVAGEGCGFSPTSEREAYPVSEGKPYGSRQRKQQTGVESEVAIKHNHLGRKAFEHRLDFRRRDCVPRQCTDDLSQIHGGDRGIRQACDDFLCPGFSA